MGGGGEPLECSIMARWVVQGQSVCCSSPLEFMVHVVGPEWTLSLRGASVVVASDEGFEEAI